MTSSRCLEQCIRPQCYGCMFSIRWVPSEASRAPDSLVFGERGTLLHVYKVASLECSTSSRTQLRRPPHVNRRGEVCAFPTAAELRGDSYFQEDWEGDVEETNRSDTSVVKEAPSAAVPEESQASGRISALAVGEGLCLVAAFLAVLRSVAQAWKTYALVSPSNGAPFQLPSASLWHILPLLLTLLIRFVRSLRTPVGSMEVTEAAGRADVGRTASEHSRIKLIEKDLGSAVRTISQVVKAVEKLGVRFRVTRRTLRDPIRETGALAEQTSQVVEVLALRAERLEDELQQTQLLMLAMQDQSSRQLALFSETMSASQRVQRELQLKIVSLQRQLQNGGLKMEGGGKTNSNPSPGPTMISTTSKRKSTRGREKVDVAVGNRPVSGENGLLQKIGALGLGLIGRSKVGDNRGGDAELRDHEGDGQPHSRESLSRDPISPDSANGSAQHRPAMVSEGQSPVGSHDDVRNCDANERGSRLAGVDFWAKEESQRGSEIEENGKRWKEQAQQGGGGDGDTEEEGGEKWLKDANTKHTLGAWFGTRSGKVARTGHAIGAGIEKDSLKQLMELDGINDDEGRRGRRGSKPSKNDKI